MPEPAEIIFHSDIPFPENNKIIYQEMYSLEQWLRRIAYACLQGKFGQDWLGVLPVDLVDQLRTRLATAKDRIHLDCERDNNLVWLTTLEELRAILTLDSTRSILNSLTGYTTAFISAKLDEIREIRNIIGHNRAVSRATVKIWQGITTHLQFGLEKFKTIVLYHNYGVQKNISPPESEFLTLHAETDFFETIIFEPYRSADTYSDAAEMGRVPSSEHPYVDIGGLLDVYRKLENRILAIIIRESSNGYSVTLSKKLSEDVQRSIGAMFLDSRMERPPIFTDIAYDAQHPKFLSHPLIWFDKRQFKEEDEI